MKLLFTACLFFLAVIYAAGQTTLAGEVRDDRGGPVPGANVFLDDTYDGTTTGTGGSFEFTTGETGRHTLVVRFVGYKEFRKAVDLEGAPVFINVALSEEINELEAVAITAGAFTASDESRRTIFRALDIASTAGATADIAGALNTLPGTQKVGESGRLFVRGGSGREARTFIDGMMVLNAYDASAPNTPSRGRFLPFMFKGMSFSTGGYSAEYGQALSSALVLDSKDKAEATRTDVGILSVGGDVSHTHAWRRASVAAKVEYTDIRPYFNLVSQRIDWITPPVSVGGSAVFRQQSGRHGMLKVFGNFSRADFSLYDHDIADPALKESLDLTNNYYYVNTAYRNTLGEDWIVRGGVSYTSQQNDVAAENDRYVETERGLHAKAVFEGSVSDRAELTAGLEMIGRDYGEQVRLANAERYHPGFYEMISAGFAEGSLYAGNSFVARAGARVEYNSLAHRAGIDPRLSLACRAGKDGSVSLAYGKFRQSPANELLRVNKDLAPEKADHYIASYQVVRGERTLRVEVYHKRYDDLVKYVDGDATQPAGNGHGYARGAELFWRDNQTFKNTDYWVSYSYLDTKRDYLNYPAEATPAFASAHNFSVVCKRFFTRLKTQLGATYSLASGRPYNDPNGEGFNDRKTPAYHDLSLNLAYLPKPHIIIYCSATNLTGRNNIFGYEFSDAPDPDGFYAGRPVRQPAKRFLFIGIFITLSKDKSISQLPAL